MRHHAAPYIRCLLWLACAVLLPVCAQQPQRSPLNPAFLDYLRERAAGTAVVTTRSGHALGYRPNPFLPTSPVATTNVQPLALPASFDLRTTGRLTPVRDQGPCGSCWAFATYSSLESYLKPTETDDFSENNLKNLHGFDWAHCDGGNKAMATAYLTRWSGPVTETDDPYDPSSGYSIPGLPLAKHVQEVAYIPGRSGPLDNDIIKQAIIDNGAVNTGMMWDDGAYNSSTYAYYYTGDGGNHGVAIVGWNDAFSRTNFRQIPPGDGAFIIRNSWGDSFGDAGYFYISYYDSRIGLDNAQFRNAEPTTNYTRNYSYDPFGWMGGYGYGTPTAWGANVFTCAGNEQVAAVGFYASTNNTSYEVRIYVSPNANSPINAAGPVAVKTGTLTWAGYYTIPLTTPVSITQGQRFSAVVKFTTPGNNYPVPFEFRSVGYTSAATGSAGQSYISYDGAGWGDIYNSTDMPNFCIKAYTRVNTVPVAVADSYTGNHDSVLAVIIPGVLTNDIDADGNPLTAQLTVAPSHGTLTLNANGSFNYTPNRSFLGKDTFTYTATDGMATSPAATVTITVLSAGWEGDVAPRATGGGGTLTVADWVQVGRFVVGLDSVLPGSEYQHTDCAPKSIHGDGILNMSDWVQAGRYFGALDPPAAADGPTAP